MKKIVIEKIPPVAPTNRIVTPLSGKELVAYVTEAGTICTLHKLSKDYKDRERFGFCNLAYSSDSGPTFIGFTWFEAIAKAGASRELVAFDSYKELLTWINHGAKVEPSPVPTLINVHYDETENLVKARWSTKEDINPHIATPIKPEDLDFNGAGQVNHTHRSMTTIVAKINELVENINVGYKKNKDRILGEAYSGTFVHPGALVVPDNLSQVNNQNTIEIPRNTFIAIMIAAVNDAEAKDRAIDLKRKSSYLISLQEIMFKLNARLTHIKLTNG